MREQISNEIKKLVQERTGLEVMLNKVGKNNGVKLTGLVIRPEGENIAPTIYLDQLIESVEYGEITAGQAADAVIAEYRRHKNRGDSFKNAFQIGREFILERAECRIVNRDMNADMLADVPSRDYLDLAVVYYCTVSENNGEKAAFIIRNDIMERCGIGFEELDKAAMHNSEKNGFQIMGMNDVLAKISGQEVPEDMEMPMYIVTNKINTNGAAALLFHGLFRELAEKLDCNLYILPSSIHEVIVIPENCGGNKECLESIVREVNDTEVPIEDKLSDSVYKWSKKDGTLSIA